MGRFFAVGSFAEPFGYLILITIVIWLIILILVDMPYKDFMLKLCPVAFISVGLAICALRKMKTYTI